MKLVYEDDFVRLWHGDGLAWMAEPPVAAVAAIITDPPYGDTPLEWDQRVPGWQEYASCLTDQLWCFGSLRFHLAERDAFEKDWRLGQEVIWEKHNGSGFNTDRFKRVHEIAVHWYRGKWANLHKAVPVTAGDRKRGVRRAQPAHRGEIKPAAYDSSDRLERSVIYCRSEHGRAVHPTQKPLGIMRPLIQFSIPKGGLVLDPFAGSGSTLLAAREMGRKAEGCEISAARCAAAVQRLSQATLEVGAA